MALKHQHTTRNGATPAEKKETKVTARSNDKRSTLRNASHQSTMSDTQLIRSGLVHFMLFVISTIFIGINYKTIK